MPRWVYECKNIKGKCFDVGPLLCTSVELEENLDNELDKLSQACDKVENGTILEQDNQIEEEITFWLSL